MPVPIIPREVLFGNPERANPKVSPDGRLLAFLAPDEGVLNVWTVELGRPLEQARPLTRDRGRGIRSFFWAEDRRSLIYLQDKDGDENWHLHQADLASGESRDLTPHAGVQAHALAADPKFPETLLVSMNLRDRRLHDVYRVDLRTGAGTLDTENPGDAVGWLADAELQVRALRASLPDGGTELRVRGSAAEPWRRLAAWGPDDSGGAHGFAPDGSLYVESDLGADTTGLLAVDPATGAERLLFRRADADLGPLLFHPRSYAVQAAGHEAERLRWEPLDPEIAADLEALGRAAQGDFQVLSRDDADRWWVVLDQSDRRPARFLLYDRRGRAAALLFTSRPALEGFALAEMRPVRIPARDGLSLPAYLSLPPEVPPGGLPLVLLVHGGPWARDRWGYHAEAQWLANRGYAVLQVNFRGSTGYGKRFLHAGDREWGAKMQDDLTDAARWAAEQGISDPKRVAIFGGSYGGYAALAGAAFTPELFACAVDVVGPSNLETLIRSIPPYWEPMKRIFSLRVGDVEREPDFLRSRSPLFHVERIRAPLLIAQGANDPRVKRAESEQIVAELRARGKEVEYLLFEDEGHGFARPENRLAFYARAEAFLARHLGGRVESMPPGTKVPGQGQAPVPS